MTLSSTDRELLQRCLSREPGAWDDLVNRFLGLVVHVVNHAAATRGRELSAQDREDLVAEVFFNLVDRDFAALRAFRGRSSLATYLTVVARRVVVRRLRRQHLAQVTAGVGQRVDPAETPRSVLERIADREQVERLLAGLHGREAEIVRMYHLEGRSYQEIATMTGVAENSIGPTLSRAREKMRQIGTAS